MQVSGRAGRDKTEGKVLIQTRYTEDDIFKHLKSQDYEGFAAGELEARRASFMVPFSAQALLVAEGKEISSVLAFLQKLKELYDSYDRICPCRGEPESVKKSYCISEQR